MAEFIAATIFAAGYIAITLEHRLFVNKAAASLVLAAALWIVTSITLPAETTEYFLAEASADIFGIIIFLLTAMTLVEILLHYHFFDILEGWLRSRGWTLKQVAWALGALTFVLSGILDNLTTTIVAIQIARRLFPKGELLRIGALIVIAANAGGAFSPVGDVTTLMLWFAHKFTADQVILQGFIPSVLLALTAGWLLLRPVSQALCGADTNASPVRPSRSDRGIMAATIGSFFLPLGAAALDLPPYFGLIAGLGVVWLLIDVAKRARPQTTHLQADIKNFLQHTDIESIQFFLGILLAVASLHALGTLDVVTDWLLGTTPTIARTATAFVGLGLGSAIIDNVPLTAAAISALEGVSAPLWVLLALTVGTGGSLLVIGSAAGVIAMGMVRSMTFTAYLRVATIPAAAGFAVAIAAWTVQYVLFF